MAHKKLRIEADVETAKAKRQVRELATEATGTSGGRAGAAANSAVMSKAAKNIKDLGDSASAAKINVREVGRAFAGMAVGMAANYAAKSMKPGAARDAVEYGGNAVAGASMLAMAGPWGMAAGGALGLLKTYLEKEGIKRQGGEEFNRGEQNYKSDRRFKKFVDDITEVGDAFERLDENIVKAKKKLEEYQSTEKEQIEKVNIFRNKGDEEKAKLQEGYLGQNRSRQEALENIIKSLEKQAKARDKIGETRTSSEGTDSLIKIGATQGTRDESNGMGDEDLSPIAASPRSRAISGGFSVAKSSYRTYEFGSVTPNVAPAIKTANEVIERINREQADILKSIDQTLKTQGGTTWQ